MELVLFVHAPAIPTELHRGLADVHFDSERLHQFAAGQADPFAKQWFDDFLFFHEACREALADKELARVEGTIAAARRATSQWLGRLVKGDYLAPRPSEWQVVAFVDRLTRCPESHDALARVRGAQIALLFEDILVRVDGPAFVAAHEAGHASQTLNEQAIQLLRTYSSPLLAAAGALALASGAGSQALARVTLADVASDGSEANFSGYPASIPTAARALIRAQRLDRRLQDAGAADAFLPSRPSNGRNGTPGILRAIIARVGAQTGLAMPPPSQEPWSRIDLLATTIHVDPL
ncbi:MAG: hypothetical protein ACR2KV_01910 [Solirubrobacteraceae bacterium]